MGSNLGAERCAWQYVDHCFGAAPTHYAETGGSKGECFHGDDASAAPLSHLLHLQRRGVQ